MKKTLALAFLLLTITLLPKHASAQSSLERCKQNTCYGYGPPAGACAGAFIFSDISATPVQAYSCKNFVWVTQGGGSSGPANVTITVDTTSVPANSCLPTVTTYFTATMVGLDATMVPVFAHAADIASISGWTPATPGLYFNPLPTAGVLKWQICNGTAIDIIPGGSTTWNVSAK
jgi:hypothetical protein